MDILVMWLVFMYFTGTVQQRSAACIYLLYFTGTVQQGSAACISSVFYRNCSTRVSSLYIFCILQELYNKGQQPVSIFCILQELYNKGQQPVSIFCILQELYNKGQQPVYLLEHEPSIVASLLKQYLRELPEPVLTTELMPKFEQASSKSKSCIKCACLRECARPNPCRKIKMAIYKLSDWVFGLIWR